MLNKNIIKEGMRIFGHHIGRVSRGYGSYDGDFRHMCRVIIDSCWNGRNFQVSSGHFSDFYTRDFSWCIEPLIKLGYKEKCAATLDYALSIFFDHKKTAVAISPDGIPLDIFSYAPDTMGLLLRSLSILNDKAIIEKYKPFLQSEVERFEHLVLAEGGTLIENPKFSSMKDHANRSFCLYDYIMIELVKNHSKSLGLDFTFKNMNYKKIIKEYYWNHFYFRDTPDSDYVAGDANVIPYWSGAIKDPRMLKSSIKTIRSEGLDKPFPLKYTSEIVSGQLSPVNLLAPNYEGNAIWGHLGPLYIDIVSKVDKSLAEKYLSKYVGLVEKHKNFYEVYHPNGKPFRSAFYSADESMSWASIILELSERLHVC